MPEAGAIGVFLVAPAIFSAVAKDAPEWTVGRSTRPLFPLLEITMSSLSHGTSWRAPLREPPGHPVHAGRPNPTMDNFLLAHLVRSRSVFEVGQALIRPEDLNGPDDFIVRAIWDATVQHHQDYYELPGLAALQTRTNARSRGDVAWTPERIAACAQTLVRIFEIGGADGPPDEPGALHRLHEFLESRRMIDAQRRAAQLAGPGQPPDPRVGVEEFFQDTLDIRRSRHRQMSDPTAPQYPADKIQPPRVVLPTGVPMLDEILRGGASPGEVNVVLEATDRDIGKILAMRVLVSSARLQRPANPGSRPDMGGLCVYVSYDEPIHFLERRALGYGARVPIDRLLSLSADMGWPAPELPGPGPGASTLGPGRPPELSPEELNRLEEMAVVVSRYVRLEGFTGVQSPTCRGRGCWGIQEIAETLDELRQEAGLPIGMVVVDSPGTAVNNYLELLGSTNGQTSSRMQTYVPRIKDEIAESFGCSVWLLQRLEKRPWQSPTGYYRHDAQCHSLTYGADSVVVVERVRPRVSICQIACMIAVGQISELREWWRVDDQLGQFVRTDRAVWNDGFFW